MPEGLSESERQQWLEQLRSQLVEETGQTQGVVEQQVPGGQPVWAMWGTTEADPEPALEAPDLAATEHDPLVARNASTDRSNG